MEGEQNPSNFFCNDMTEKDIFSNARHVGVFTGFAVLLDAAPGFLAAGNAWVNVVQIVHFLVFLRAHLKIFLIAFYMTVVI